MAGVSAYPICTNENFYLAPKSSVADSIDFIPDLMRPHKKLGSRITFANHKLTYAVTNDFFIEGSRYHTGFLLSFGFAP